MHTTKVTKPEFKAAISNGTLELSIYNDIGQEFDGITAASVKQAIDEMQGPINSISLRINSAGGNAFEGLAIYNLLRAQKKPINVYVDGLAASAALTIAMAGDSVTMGTGSMMMIHNAWTITAGNASDLRTAADTLDLVSSSMSTIYQAKTGMDEKAMLALMDAETWMNAQQAVDDGFADDIATYDDDPDDTGALNLARSFKALSRMKNVPEKFRAAPKPEPKIEPVEPNIEMAQSIPSNLSLYAARLKSLRVPR